jgi:nanoRNase/pAp phosphatase (c-di-AMP/oligoRNAs hydrolase)
VVDAQPGAGNIGLPEEITPTIVLDHHPALHSETKEGQFVDIRTGCGATSTIVTGYLRAVGLAPDRQTATALFYGIKSDTMGLARAAGEADVEAYLYLLPLADPKTLAEIEQAQVPLAYFRAFEQALERTYIYADVVVCDLGAMDWPDLAAEMADFLLRWEGAQWVLCTGLFDGTIVISVRTTDLDGDAGRVVQAVVRGLGTGGGHGLLAGGRVPLNSTSQAELTRRLRDRFLLHLERDEQAREKLIQQPLAQNLPRSPAILVSSNGSGRTPALRQPCCLSLLALGQAFSLLQRLRDQGRHLARLAALIKSNVD